MDYGSEAVKLVSRLVRISDVDQVINGVDQGHWTCAWKDGNAATGVLIVSHARVFRTFNAAMGSGISIKWTVPLAKDSSGRPEDYRIDLG